MPRASRLAAAIVLLAAATAAARTEPTARGASACLRASGAAARGCLATWERTLRACRLGHDAAACEAAARADAGPLARALDAAAGRVRSACPLDADGEPLGYTSAPDVVQRIRDACGDWGDDVTALTVGAAGSADGALLGCRRDAARRLGRLADAVAAVMARCDERAFRGEGCAHPARDRHVAALRDDVRRRLARRCGDDFARLGLGTLDDALDALVTRGRHFALLTSPPNDLGPTAALGPYPIGVRTIALADGTRTNVAGTGPRPVTVEVYYPSTAEAVAGVPRDVATVLGVPIVATPAHRDVAPAPGRFPLVLFSHGNGGIRIQSLFFTTHLASHGYVVVSPDHHGNTFVDALAGVVDPDTFANRPLDLSFLIDTFTTPGGPLADSVDPARIGVSGHSLGGYTAFAVAGGPTRDPRVDAIMPQAPFAEVLDATFLGTIGVPVLVVGGSLDETTPFPENQARPYADLPAVAPITALAELVDAGHFTFSDFCEVPRDLLAFLGGFDEACEPRHLPWRHAHDIVDYLGLNFFDAVLRGDGDALARLDPARVAGFDGATLERKR